MKVIIVSFLIYLWQSMHLNNTNVKYKLNIFEVSGFLI